MIVRIYTGDDGQSHFEELGFPDRAIQRIATKSGEDLISAGRPRIALVIGITRAGVSTSSSLTDRWRSLVRTARLCCSTPATCCWPKT